MRINWGDTRVYPCCGDTRTKEWFAIMPVTINGETRWMEKVSVLQMYKLILWSHGHHRWVDVKFTDSQRSGDTKSWYDPDV